MNRIFESIESSWPESMQIADRLIDCLRGDYTDRGLWGSLFWESLAKSLRVLQFEIMPRDLFPSGGTAVNFRSGTSLRCVKGYLDEAKLAELTSAYSYSPQYLHNIPTTLDLPVDLRYPRFEYVLSRCTAYNPFSYEDFLATFESRFRVNKIAGKEASITTEAILIEDGELTFFTLLWVLRYGLKRDFPIRQWLRGEIYELPLDFQPPVGDGGGSGWWGSLRLDDLLTRLGLVVRAPDGNLKSTSRWASFRKWLARQNAILRHYCGSINSSLYPDQVTGILGDRTAPTTAGIIPSLASLSNDDLLAYVSPFLRILPVTQLRCFEDHNSEPKLRRGMLEWAYLLIAFFLACGSEFSQQDKDSDPAEIIDFLNELLGETGRSAIMLQLLTDTQDLINLSATSGQHDQLLNRLARPGYLPLEYILRNSLPFEMHLLVVPFDYVEEHLFGGSSAVMTPTSLGFMTIAGSIMEKVGTEFQASGLTPDSKQIALDWLQPYYMILSRLDHYFTTETLWKQREGSVQLAADSRFGHETKHLILGLRDGWKQPLFTRHTELAYFDYSTTLTPQGSLKLGLLYDPSKEVLLEFLDRGPLRNISLREYAETVGIVQFIQTGGETSLFEFVRDRWGEPSISLLIGKVKEAFYSSFSLITHNDLFTAGLNHLLLWSDVERGALNLLEKLPYTIDDLGNLARICWKWTIETLLVHAFRDQLFSPNHIQTTSSMIWAVRHVYTRGDIIKSDTTISLRGNSQTSKSTPYEHRERLAKYFLVLLREHLQHSRCLTLPSLEFREVLPRRIQIIHKSHIPIVENRQNDRSRALALIREATTIGGFSGFSDEAVLRLIENGIIRLSDLAPRKLGKQILRECLNAIDQGFTFEHSDSEEMKQTGVYESIAELSFNY